MQPKAESQKSQFWVYPTNYPVRDYQLNICKEALFINTLVCLPTGLGKTLIAAVVMYNYYSWFPTGKVIFMAPSRPLVEQQIKACHSIMGIPEQDTAHLEGSVQSDKRALLWRSKRVFFCTPQTLLNDIDAGRCDPLQVVCVVVDEAHKATENYAYTSIVQQIAKVSNHFRVLALSATPGSDTTKIQSVIRNLHIAHIEIRTEDDPEVEPFRHERQIDIVKCPFGSFYGTQAVKALVNELLLPALQRLNLRDLVFCDNPAELNTFLLSEADRNLAQLVEADKQLSPQIVAGLRNDLAEVRHLLDGRRLLTEDGVSGLLDCLQKRKQIVRIGGASGIDSVVYDPRFERLLSVLSRAKNDPQYLERRQPKIAKLKTILVEHFQRHGKVGNSTRALIFTHLRSTVHEIKVELEDVPGLRPHEFVGQADSKSSSGSSSETSKGLTQQQQAQILRQFNQGTVNVLVATSIAEEGLDISEVDLLVLFEVVSSPIRLVQRMGRTGRKRSGRVVMLVSEGVEEDKVERSADGAEAITKALRNATRSLKLCPHNSPMFPSGALPTMRLQEMQVGDFHHSQVAGSGAIAAAKKGLVFNSVSETDISKFFLPARQTSNPVTKECRTVAHQPANSNPWQSSSTLFGSSSSDSRRLQQSSLERHVQHPSYVAGGHSVQQHSEVDDPGLYGWSLSAPSVKNQLSLPPAKERSQPSAVVPSSSRISDSHQAKPLHAQTGDKFLSDSLFKAAAVVPAAQSVLAYPVFNSEPFVGTENAMLTADCTAATTTALRNVVRSATHFTASFLPSDLDSEAEEEDSQSQREKDAPLSDSSHRINSISSPFLSANPLQPPLEESRNWLQESWGASPIPQMPRQVALSSTNYQQPQTQHSPYYPAEHFEEACAYSAPDDHYAFLVAPISPVVATSSRKHNGIAGRSVANTATTGASRSDSVSNNKPPLGHSAAKKHKPSSSSAAKITEAPVVYKQSTLQMNSVAPNSSASKVTSSSSNFHDVSVADTTVDTEYDSVGQCWVCLSAEPLVDDPIVFCDGLCGTSSHLSCYGLHSLPPGDFFCDGCTAMRSGAQKATCVLCFRAGGLMKRSVCGKWVHLLCVLFTPELTLNDRMQANNLSKLDPDRDSLVCKLCGRGGGSCVQCHYADCMEAFHPFCAYQSRTQQMVVREVVEQNGIAGNNHCFLADGGMAYELYCKAHRDKVDPRHVMSSRNPIRQGRPAPSFIVQKPSGLVNTNVRATSAKNALDSPGALRESDCSQLEESLDTQDLLDTAEKPPRRGGNAVEIPRKRLRKASTKQSRLETGGLLLQSKKLRREVQPTVSAAAARKKDVHSAKVANFFELEAELSGSDGPHSGSSSEDEQEEEEVLSGNFINDGSFTQHSPPSSKRSKGEGAAMYLAVNQYRHLMDSPDDFLPDGGLNVRKLVRGGAGRVRTSDVECGDSVVDTPDITRRESSSSDDDRHNTGAKQWGAANKHSAVLKPIAARRPVVQSKLQNKVYSSSSSSDEERPRSRQVRVAGAYSSSDSDDHQAKPKPLQQRAAAPSLSTLLSKSADAGGAAARNTSGKGSGATSSTASSSAKQLFPFDDDW